MAIQWKRSIPEWTDMNPSSVQVVYTLCGSGDSMNSIKSISIVNGNPTTYIFANIWVDTSGIDANSPEYSTTPIYLIRKSHINPKSIKVYNSIINNATWSSKGAILKCSIEVSTSWIPGAGFSTSKEYFGGSIILSGQDDNLNTPNIT